MNSPDLPATPWQHGQRDVNRTGARYHAHDTGALLARLETEHYWTPSWRYSRRSHDPARRPFALHAATLVHPDAPVFQALGISWQMSLYLRNAHDGTAALQSTLLLAPLGRGASALAQAPGSCRIRHSVPNEEAQRIASAAAEAIPQATALLYSWQSEPARRSIPEIAQAALIWRYGPTVTDRDGVQHTPQLAPDCMPGFTVATRLDEYLAAAWLAMRGDYYLQTSQRACRELKNVLAREKIMAQAWEWIHETH